MIIAEGDDIDRLVIGGAIQDAHVLVVAVNFQHGQAAVHELLATELGAHDVDLTAGTGHSAQVTTGALGAQDVLLATLGINSVNGFIELVEIQSTTTVGDDLGVGASLGSGETNGKAVELIAIAIAVAIEEQGFKGQAHGAHLGLDLEGAGLRTLQFNDGTVNANVTTEELQRFAVLTDFSVALIVAIVEGAEPDVAEILFTLPEKTRALDFAEREGAEQGTGRQFGDDCQFLGIAAMLFSLN